jgi:hypothetical protein
MSLPPPDPLAPGSLPIGKPPAAHHQESTRVTTLA